MKINSFLIVEAEIFKILAATLVSMNIEIFNFIIIKGETELKRRKN